MDMTDRWTDKQKKKNNNNNNNNNKTIIMEGGGGAIAPRGAALAVMPVIRNNLLFRNFSLLLKCRIDYKWLKCA